ncbi:bifunctional riboflavin kinase/FAD synthetase [Rhizobiaceae bacterium]|nr:bifunctional riboflavin kinase/FAD synthetase [Rhizobiaceae bacterium]
MPETRRGGVVAIGNFDGVHRGHQTVLAEARNIANAAGVPAYALTFEPHPRTLFKPDAPVFRLTPDAVKARVVEAAGLDGLLVLPFDRELAGTSAQDFVDRHIVKATSASHVVSGYDFMFGKDRQGTPDFLVAAGTRAGFGVTIVERHEDGGEALSSSRIRSALAEGDITHANAMLGYRWSATGEVVKGAQLGRTLGYPTANLVLPESCDLAHGIYAVRLRRADGTLHDGVASYGRRPTFDNGPAWLETFIFDFSDDLYGETITVSLFERLRGEVKFDGADALIAQMDLDAEQSRAILAKAEPLSPLDAKLTFHV